MFYAKFHHYSCYFGNASNGAFRQGDKQVSFQVSVLYQAICHEIKCNKVLKLLLFCSMPSSEHFAEPKIKCHISRILC